MKLCRFRNLKGEIRVGLISREETLFDLSTVGAEHLQPLLEASDLSKELAKLTKQNPAPEDISAVQFLTPVEHQEVWAAGVTYLRSKKARMEESNFSANAYDRVYDAIRPELFFKSLPEKVVSPGQPVGIRKDAKWNVPEPELALVVNSRGRIVGYTIGNDMSSRDIEGENLLYLPQAKVYDRSCAVGPVIAIETSEQEARGWEIQIAITRGGNRVFEGSTSVSQIKRSFDELARFLCRCQTFPYGAVLLTGTGVVPPDQFTLEVGDEIEIGISGIGTLRNSVVEV